MKKLIDYFRKEALFVFNYIQAKCNRAYLNKYAYRINDVVWNLFNLRFQREAY
jgi:hypothetical protein